jgi:hypothetical protein
MTFKVPTNPLFLQAFKGWNRVEPRSRADDFAESLKTAVADPLWMLGRQWQAGELKGEDAGTPVSVALDHEIATLTHIKLGESGRLTELSQLPAEVLVEREAVPWDWRLRLRAGQQFERILRLKFPTNAENLIGNVRTLCPMTAPQPATNEWLETDYPSQRFATLLEQRAIDGQKVMEKADSGALALIVPSVAIEDWRSWYRCLFSQSTDPISPTWQPELLNYKFGIGVSSSTSTAPLVADSYRNGSIDWHSFSFAGSLGVTFESQATEYPTPTRASFPGMPNRRWWQFEDGAVSFCDLDVAKTDLAKLALLEFALVFGDDWFVVPLRVDARKNRNPNPNVNINTLVRVTSLVVKDCFGVTTPIKPAREIDAQQPTRSWQVYTLARVDDNVTDSVDFLYVPPPAGLREESPPIELLKFLRDETANMCFAVEHIVPNRLGDPMRGFQAHLELLRRQRAIAPSAPPAPSDTTPAVIDPARLPPPNLDYVVATKVPENWIPFIPYDAQPTYNNTLPAQVSVKLRRANILTSEAGQQPLRIAALSRLLGETGNTLEWVAEEVIGREGAQVELRRQRVRSVTGETFVWLGRTVKVGQGEGKSGLAFDSVTKLK